MAKSNEFLISAGIGLIIDYPLIHIKNYATPIINKDSLVKSTSTIISIDELAKINQIVNEQIKCLKKENFNVTE